jgi:hypothetical protein
LLSRAALLWFVPLLEKNSHLFEDLDDFLTEFNFIFGKIDRGQTTTTKFCSLYQISRPTLVYVVDFYQLAYDVNWDDNIFISVFWWSSLDDVKDLFLNLLDLLILTKAIIQVVQYDNRLFECRQEWRSTQGPYKVEH